jgi:hypothetical protein
MRRVLFNLPPRYQVMFFSLVGFIKILTLLLKFEFRLGYSVMFDAVYKTLFSAVLYFFVV